MKRFCVLLLALLLLLLCSGCQNAAVPAADAPTGGEELTADIQEEPLSGESMPDGAPLLAFSAELLEQSFAEETLNPVLSPLSAYLCLALAAGGASGQTAEAFERVMGFDADSLQVFSRGLLASLHETGGSTALRVADSVWADDDAVSLDSDYLQRVVNGGADAFTYDLPSDAALEAVNAWVNEKTNGLIQKLHDENYPDDTVLLLINALYFKAKWDWPFIPQSTYDKPFHLADGSSAQVPFLSSSGSRDWIKTSDAEGILLPYDDGRTAFVALRPTDGRSVRAFAASLGAKGLSAYMESAEDTYLEFSMPKFSVEYSTEMNKLLTDMGLGVMFDPGSADFSGIGTAKDGNIFVSSVVQKVKLTVDEEGTEAAAVTEAAMATGAVMDPAVLHLNSPFYYAVVDRESGALLFAGILDDPA